MADREKAIRALEWCIEKPCHPNCPYFTAGQEMCLFTKILPDALALLKDQEPRVLTLEELQAIETPWNRNTPPYLFVEKRSSTEARWMSWGFMHDGVRLPGTMGVQNYGTKWRVWNLQPTPKQMRETKWEGDKE